MNGCHKACQCFNPSVEIFSVFVPLLQRLRASLLVILRVSESVALANTLESELSPQVCASNTSYRLDPHAYSKGLSPQYCVFVATCLSPQAERFARITYVASLGVIEHPCYNLSRDSSHPDGSPYGQRRRYIQTKHNPALGLS